MEEGEKKQIKGRGVSLARSKVHRHEGTYVLYPPNIEHDMWFTKEMKRILDLTCLAAQAALR